MSEELFRYGFELVLDRNNKADADEEAKVLIDAFDRQALKHGARIRTRTHLWVAVVKPGTDDPIYYVAGTQAGLFRQVAKYCREWWDPDDGEMPDNEQELVEEFFRTADDEIVEVKEVPVA